MRHLRTLLLVLLPPIAAAQAEPITHTLASERHPERRTLLKVLEPEGAQVVIFDAGRRVFEDDVPCTFEAHGDKYYRVQVRKGDRVWEKKIAARPGEVATLSVRFPDEPPPSPPRGAVIGDADFKELLLAIDSTRIYKDKVELVRAAAKAHRFEASQAARLVDLTPLSMDKLEMLRALQGRIVDPENYFKIYAHLKLDGDKRKAREILEGEPAASP